MSGGKKVFTAVSGKEISIMFGILMLLCFIVFHKFIFGSAVYLFNDIGGDSLNSYYPSYINISGILKNEGIPGWSFEQGLGQNVFPFSLSDPSLYPLYVLNQNYLASGIIWVEIFKIICSGLLFFCFLKKLNSHTNAAYIGGLLYAFSGFMIVGGAWYTFSTIGLYTALILLSFEMLYLEKKWWLFPISVALLAAFNFVSLYTCSFFLWLYIIFRILSEEKFNVGKLAPLLVQILFLGVLGVLTSAVFSVPNLLQMIYSPRISGSASLESDLASLPMWGLENSTYQVTLLMRTFSSDLLGNGSAFKGWNNYLEAPLSYCGLISLLLVPQAFCFLKNRQKIVYGIFIGLFIFAEIFPWFRRGFWLFQGDYFRDFSLYGCIIFILFAMTALDKLINGGRINFWVLGMSLVTLLSLLYFPFNLTLENADGSIVQFKFAIDHHIQARIAIFLVLIGTVLIFLSMKKYRKYTMALLLACTFIEVANFTYDTVNKRDVMTMAGMQQYLDNNEQISRAIASIRGQDRDFFRIEKNYGGYNDAKVQHYFGSSAYHSFNQINYINFLDSSAVLNSKNEAETRWVDGVKNEPLLQILTGVKYLLFKGDWKSYPILTDIYTEAGNFNDITILKSRYALPIGVAYRAYILQSDFIWLDSPHKKMALLKAIMIPDESPGDFSEMHKVTASDLATDFYSNETLAQETEHLKADSLQLHDFSNNHIEGEIKTDIKQLVFFSFPFDSGWKAKVNGKDTNMLMVDGGLSAVLVDPGKNVISLRYFPPFVEMGFYLSLLGLLIFGAIIFWQRTVYVARQ